MQDETKLDTTNTDTSVGIILKMGNILHWERRDRQTRNDGVLNEASVNCLPHETYSEILHRCLSVSAINLLFKNVLEN